MDVALDNQNLQRSDKNPPNLDKSLLSSIHSTRITKFHFIPFSIPSKKKNSINIQTLVMPQKKRHPQFPKKDEKWLIKSSDA